MKKKNIAFASAATLAGLLLSASAGATPVDYNGAKFDVLVTGSSGSPTLPVHGGLHVGRLAHLPHGRQHLYIDAVGIWHLRLRRVSAYPGRNGRARHVDARHWHDQLTWLRVDANGSPAPTSAVDFGRRWARTTGISPRVSPRTALTVVRISRACAGQTVRTHLPAGQPDSRRLLHEWPDVGRWPFTSSLSSSSSSSSASPLIFVVFVVSSSSSGNQVPEPSSTLSSSASACSASASCAV